MWSAICYALTGETINGIKTNLKNINVEETECYVQLDFLYNKDLFSIHRIVTPKSDLKIFKNDVDLSGKGIRESEKKLQELLPELSKDLMWMKLHVDSFKYSVELEEYLSCYEKTSDFSKSFVNTEFKVAIAKIVISMHHGRFDEAKQFFEKAKDICKPNHVGKLYNILARHKYHETLNTTPEAITFVKQLKL